MKTTNKLIIASFILFPSLSPSIATAKDETGFYIGAGVARSDARISGRGSDSGNNFDEADNNPAVRLGYMFSPKLGVDATVVGLDRNNGDGLRADAGIFALSLIGNIGLTDLINLYGKAGAAQIRTELKLPNGRELRDESDTEFFWAVGSELDLGQHNVFLEYNRFDTDGIDINSAILGYKYQF